MVALSAELRLMAKLRSQRMLTTTEGVRDVALDVARLFKSGRLRERNTATMPEKRAVFIIAMSDQNVRGPIIIRTNIRILLANPLEYPIRLVATSLTSAIGCEFMDTPSSIPTKTR